MKKKKYSQKYYNEKLGDYIARMHAMGFHQHSMWVNDELWAQIKALKASYLQNNPQYGLKQYVTTKH